MRALLALFAVLAGALVLATGCGGDDGGGATGGDSAASIAPSGAALYASINTDLDSDQIDTLEGLLDKFPDGDRFLEMLRDELQKEDGLDWERDVRPALGDTLDVVVLDFEGGEDNVVGMLKPADREKFEALAEKTDEESVNRQIEGWTVFADTAAVLDRFETARRQGTLDENDRFEAAMEGLPDEAVAKLFVNGDAVTEAAREGGAPTDVKNKLRSLGLALGAESSGLQLDGVVKAELEGEYASMEPYKSKFLEEVPAGALVFVSYNGYGKLSEAIREAAGGDPFLDQFRRLLGVDVGDLARLLDGELAFYVRQGAPIPEITLLSEVENEEQALATLDKLADRVAELADARRTETTLDGVRVRQLAFEGVRLFYGAFDGRVIVTTGQNAISRLREEGDKLADDPKFKEAREAVDMPDETFGFVYVDVEEIVGLASGFAGAAGEQVPGEVERNLEPLGAFMAYASGETEDAKLSAFLSIE